jgi:uncharacterized protein YndB with AHSA1/START domain
MTMTIDETVLELTRVFDAAPARVFNAWLDREEWQSWLGPEGTTCEVPLLEPRIGGKYRILMTLSDGRLAPVAGAFTAIDPPSRLAFTWTWEGDDTRQSLVTLSFRDLGGKTEMTLRQEGLGTIESRDGHGKGWNSALNKLERYLADRPV